MGKYGRQVGAGGGRGRGARAKGGQTCGRLASYHLAVAYRRKRRGGNREARTRRMTIRHPDLEKSINLVSFLQALGKEEKPRGTEEQDGEKKGRIQPGSPT